jgi:hypothetical protein
MVNEAQTLNKSAAHNWFKNDQASLEDKKHISRPAISKNN